MTALNLAHAVVREEWRPAATRNPTDDRASTEKDRSSAAEVTEVTELMRRYCAGEVAAFHRTYALLAPRILAYLRAMVGDRESAEDLLQQTFLKVHEARSTYLIGANPIPWIYTIARRTCFDEFRRRRGSRVRLTSDGELPRFATAPIMTMTRETRAATIATRVAAVMAALQHLPRNQRQALILAKVQGKSLAEVARGTGCSQGAIKLRIHRAYVRLRDILGNQEESD